MKKKHPEEEIIFAFMFNVLEMFGVLSQELRAAIMARARIRTFNKREVILKRGDICRYCYFSFSGLVRGFFETPKKEVTEWFMDEKDIFIWPNSFFYQIPSVGSIIALEDIVTVELSYDDYTWLNDNFPDFKNIDDKATKYYYGKTYERIEMKGYTGTENYNKLLERYPRVIKIARVEDIASYLGISRQALTKIRGALKK